MIVFLKSRCLAKVPHLKGIVMSAYDQILDRFEQKSPFAVLVRVILQRLLPPDQLDRLFDETAEKQYQRTLLFSTLMTLMLEVVLKSSPSVHHSYQRHQDDIDVSVKAVYDKLNGLEPNIAAELVRHSVRQLRPLQRIMRAEAPELLPGHRVRIIDGNRFSGTAHRLKGTRGHHASPLPGFVLAVLDPRYRMFIDMIPCEDGHASERLLFPQIEPLVEKDDLWIADRNFATRDLMFDIASKSAFFLMRQHGSLKAWAEAGEEKYAGKTATGHAYEQRICVTHTRTDETLALRRIRLELFEKTRDGETEIVLLTNLSKRSASAIVCCDLYRDRWGIERAFLEMAECLSCEIDTLCYPRAAVFAFCLASMLYNAVSLMKSVIAAVHGEEALDNMSWYYASTETHAIWPGMEIALPFSSWSRRIDGMTNRELAGYLKSLAAGIAMSKYTKSRRGPKKKVTKIRDPKVNHVSTFKILQERKNNKK
jgi:hypothetical protein